RGQTQRHRAADAAAGARHHGHLVLEPHGGHLLAMMGASATGEVPAHAGGPHRRPDGSAPGRFVRGASPVRLVEQWRRALERARRGQLAVLRQPWHRPVPGGQVAPYLVKVLCADERRLAAWGTRFGLPARGICRHGRIPHYDLWGPLAERAWAELA